MLGEVQMSKWKTLYNDLAGIPDDIKPNPPATNEQICDVEEKLKIELPADLKELLFDMNGDDWLIFSTEQIVETNTSVRKLDFYMPLDCFLFFAGNGCGDYYGYPITLADGVRTNEVFIWEHESDCRIWKANGLEDTIRKYYNDEI